MTMKLFSLLLSITVFFVSLFFFLDKIPIMDSFNDMIYVSLLALLMAICIIGVIINREYFSKNKKEKINLFIVNSFSKTKKT